MHHTTQSGRGIFFGLIAAIFYGLVPTFTLPIFNATENGVTNVDYMPQMSILFYRFFIAAIILGIIMAVRRTSFRITRGEAVTLTYLAFLSDGAALFLIAGFDYMTSGVGTTIHFMYPVITAVLMMLFYNEARRPLTIGAVAMAVIGVALLSWPTGQVEIKFTGVVLELFSAICFALYIIRLNRSRVATMDNLKLTFYVILIGSFIFGAEALREDNFVLITTPTQGVDLVVLAVCCTVITNLSLVLAVKYVGSTTAAVLGALEPVTAVVLGCLLFGELITWNIVVGILLILPAVVTVILSRRR